MGKNDFYISSTPSVDYYTGTTTGSEPNMRQELIDTLSGSFPEIAKAQSGLLRRMRRDSSDNLIPCTCVDAITKEPDKDRFCNFCMGDGYYWDEEDLLLYKVLEDSDSDNTLSSKLQAPGLINASLVVFYIRYDSDITIDDKIVTLKLDEAGDAVTPYKRREIYRISKAWDYRADNGKLEYWKIFTHTESVKHLNAPSYGDL